MRGWVRRSAFAHEDPLVLAPTPTSLHITPMASPPPSDDSCLADLTAKLSDLELTVPTELSSPVEALAAPSVQALAGLLSSEVSVRACV